jgi:hypothetical protein
VHTLAGERVEVGRKRGDQGLALTGLHLGDVAEVERRASHELNVEVAQAERASSGLSNCGERLGKQVVEALAVFETLAQGGRLFFQFVVSEVFEPVFEGVDRLRVGLEPAKNATFTNTKNLFKN